MLNHVLAILYIAMLYWLPVWWLLSPYLLLRDRRDKRCKGAY